MTRSAIDLMRVVLKFEVGSNPAGLCYDLRPMLDSDFSAIVETETETEFPDLPKDLRVTRPVDLDRMSSALMCLISSWI